MTRTKICCISSVEEAHLAVRHGSSAIGLVSEMPSGPGVIPESLIGEIADTVPPPVATFLLTSLTSPPDIIAQHKRCRTNTIQICDRIAQGAYAELRAALPGIALLFTDQGEIERAVELYALASTFGIVANSKWFADIAGDEITEAAEKLPADVIEAAKARGRELDLWQTAEELLAEMEEMGWSKPELSDTK